MYAWQPMFNHLACSMMSWGSSDQQLQWPGGRASEAYLPSSRAPGTKVAVVSARCGLNFEELDLGMDHVLHPGGRLVLLFLPDLVESRGI